MKQAVPPAGSCEPHIDHPEYNQESTLNKIQNIREAAKKVLLAGH